MSFVANGPSHSHIHTYKIYNQPYLKCAGLYTKFVFVSSIIDVRLLIYFKNLNFDENLALCEIRNYEFRKSINRFGFNDPKNPRMSNFAFKKNFTIICINFAILN